MAKLPYGNKGTIMQFILDKRFKDKYIVFDAGSNYFGLVDIAIGDKFKEALAGNKEYVHVKRTTNFDTDDTMSAFGYKVENSTIVRKQPGEYWSSIQNKIINTYHKQ